MIYAIIGPTGVGKTKLSIMLAKKLNAEIINCDSQQVYKELSIGVAKIKDEEKEGIVHHLIDVCSVTENYSVYDYQKDVRRLIEDINKRGKRIIIVGGTGLYIKAALYDYKFTEGTINNNYDDYSKDELISKINSYGVSIDDVSNRRRLVRLLNKLENNEEITNNKDVLLYPSKFIGLTTDRAYLYERINERVDKMMKSGLLDEILGLKQYYLNSRVLNSAIGYKEFYDYLFGDTSIDDVVERIKLDSRRFAKRQYTFFNHQFNTTWFDVNFDDFEKTVEEVYNFIEEKKEN